MMKDLLNFLAIILIIKIASNKNSIRGIAKVLYNGYCSIIPVLTVFWDCNGIIHMDYCPPKQTINAAYYSSLLQTVHSKLPRIRSGKIHKRPLFLQDNTRVHTAKGFMAKLRYLKWQLLPHPAYTQDLAPSDFHLFGPLKDSFRDRRFKCESELKSAVNKVIKIMSTDWFEEGKKKVAERWRKCIDLQGDCVEK